MGKSPWPGLALFRRPSARRQVEDLRAALGALEARADALEAALFEQRAWAAEARAELLALAQSLQLYRRDVEALEAARLERPAADAGGPPPHE